MFVEPMLATTGPLPKDEERWSFEPKWDGFRAIVHTDGRRLRVVSRRGTDLAGRLPELAALTRALTTDTVLDGELVILDAEGGVDFEAMRRRGFGQPDPGRLVFVAFDVLSLAGEEVMTRPWEARRAMLADLMLEGPHWCVTPSYPGEGSTLFDATRAQGIEGVMAKRLDAPYRPGVRTAAWVKTKHFERGWFEVLGIAPTPEKRYALILGIRGGGQVHYAGRVEWGVTRERFEELAARGRPTEVSPFGRWAPAGALFLEPGVVAEVRYLAGSQLRHATLQSLAFERPTGADEERSKAERRSI